MDETEEYTDSELMMMDGDVLTSMVVRLFWGTPHDDEAATELIARIQGEQRRRQGIYFW